MSEATIRVSGLSHRYGKVAALQDVTLEFPSGIVTGVIGPDGVGKSTLLAAIAGARRIQSGEVQVLDGEMGDAGHRRRVSPKIAYMPQGLGRNLYAELSVGENLDFFARLFETPAAERGTRTDHLLESTGLAPFRDRPAGKLSGGMKQKLGLCCALIHDPDLLILDEPTTGVDPLSRRQFWILVDAIRARRPGMTVVVSTAYMEEAESFERLVAMDGGRVVATGSPGELRDAAGVSSLEAAYRAVRHGAPPEPLSIPPWREDGGEPVISASGLTRCFGDFVAVDRVGFQIQRGEIFGFLGSNGCGKSTTMKMLTGLLPASQGEARLFGRPVDHRDREARREIGYMSQAYSLYGELTVRQNLDLHARIFRLSPAIRTARIEVLTERFGLQPYMDQLSADLPLGVRQRLSLAVAVIHEPRVLILDEPTSGVDPDARDEFWRLLIELSREQGVTIFISTHFMTEAMLCDRISLMHAGRVLACDTPKRLIEQAGAMTLEEAFIHHLREAAEDRSQDPPPAAAGAGAVRPRRFSLVRLGAYARREVLEVIRDRVRLAFAFLGPAILMTVFSLGITLDIEGLRFVVFDQDRTPESRGYIAAFEGSRFFAEGPLVESAAAARERLVRGEASLAIEIPPGFGRALTAGEPAEVLATVDGAFPFKGETVQGYAEGIHRTWMSERAHEAGVATISPAAVIESRFRYNPAFESINAMAPGMPTILLMFFPAILTAVAVARERELGTITNMHVTPATRVEFLVGKQAPYVVIGFLNFVLLVLMITLLFGVPLKGEVLPVALGALLYLWASTAFGLVIATLTRSQVAAVFATAIISILPTIQFSGLLRPISTLEPGAQAIASLWPSSYFLHLSVGGFAKGLGWAALAPDVLALAIFGPVFTAIAVLALRPQEH